MNGRLVTAVLMGLMAVDARIGQAATGEASEPEVVVVVSACPVVAAETLSGAVETMVGVYRALGVRLRVVKAGAEPLRDHVLWRRVLVRASATPDLGVFDRRQVMGRSPRSGDAPGLTGYVFFDTVVRTADRYSVPVETLLGYAMAHELGHLLLPTGAHGEAGVMRATWTLSDLDAIRKHSLTMASHESDLVHSYLDSYGRAQ